MVGMSGGVDSSVTAALLKKRGYDVIGITMQLLPAEEERKSACCNLGAVDDAKRVAAKLGIPHYTINSRDNFQKHVIDDFIQKYSQGVTPNPCVECNRFIKFDELWRYGRDLDADYVATGHYCKITKSPKTGKYFLKKAADSSKDQSYFLYMLTQEKLQKILFPLSKYTKTEIRQMAESMGLLNAKKPDSQEICFVSQKSYKDYVKSHLPDESKVAGDILNTQGEVIGQHSGIFQFTIGQKKGLNLPFPYPLFVLHIDPLTNRIMVGDRDALQKKTLHLHTVTLVDESELILGKHFEVRTRYQMTPIAAKVLSQEKNKMSLELSSASSMIAPGQSCVLYQKDRIVGGGILS